MISIIVPCYDEENTIIQVVQKLFLLEIEKEVIVINDGSTDMTRRKLDSLKNVPDNLKIIHLAENHGKGNAIRIGIKMAVGDIVVIQDADLEYDPQDIPKLIKPIEDGYADVVYGSRFKGSSPKRALYFKHYLANQLLTFLSNLSTNINLSDIETGFKAFRREIIQRTYLKENGFGIEPEITAKIARYRVYEVGISYYGREYKDGKKIGFKDGFEALWCILKYSIIRRKYYKK